MNPHTHFSRVFVRKTLLAETLEPMLASFVETTAAWITGPAGSSLSLALDEEDGDGKKAIPPESRLAKCCARESKFRWKQQVD